MLISLKDYADLHEKSSDTIRRLAETGMLASARKIGRNWVVDSEEIYPVIKRQACKRAKKLQGISLFSGAGGLDVGFERAGVFPVWANEFDKTAAATYMENHPNTFLVVDDINNVIDELQEYRDRDIDIVFGGPPCQGFSVAGKMDADDPRNQLIFSFLKAVQIVQPKVFVMENVKALAELDKWDGIRNQYLKTSEGFDGSKYLCTKVVLNASDYGVPQKRERVFFIGIKYNDEEHEEAEKKMSQVMMSLQEQRSTPTTIRELIEDLGRAGTKKNPETCTAKITFAKKPVLRKSPYAGMYFNGAGRPVDVDGYANTLPASMGGNKTPILDDEYLYGDSHENWAVTYHRELYDEGKQPRTGEVPKRLRRMTIKEAKRIQTFPDEYIFCGGTSAIYRQIGNAVPCELAFVVANAVVKNAL